MKRIFLIAMLLFATLSFSQQLRLKSGGRIYDSKMEKLNGREMRELLATKPGMLQMYNSARTKASFGGFMIGFGGGLVIGDLLVALRGTSEYPSALTYVGAATALLSIPVLNGHKKKLKSAIDAYNKEISVTDSSRTFEQLSIFANTHGAGLRITF